MANENMAEFNAAKHEVDDMMNFISTILYGSVNGEDPDTIEMQVGCGGQLRKLWRLSLIIDYFGQPADRKTGCWLTFYPT